MALRLNRALFEQVRFDSGYPTGSAAVVHKVSRAGEYAIALLQDDKVVESRKLVVAARLDDPAAEARSARPPVPKGVTIDLQAASTVKPALTERIDVVEADGYVSFSASKGKPHRVQLRRADGNEEFDSERLRDGDLFALTLIRPGRYAIRNVVGKTEGTIVVTYPVVGDTPYRPEPPLRLRCDARGFSPDEATIGPLQGLVVEAGTDARIVVDLVEPDDGPPSARSGGGPAPRASLRRVELSEPDESSAS